MGYSIMTPFETEADRQKMKTFLTEHFQPIEHLSPHLASNNKQAQTWFSKLPHDDLSYMSSTNDPVLGCDYGAGDSDEARDYSYTLCYWMAIHSGKRRNGRPCIIYDGCEYWTVFANESPSESEKKDSFIEVNKFGYRPMSSLKQIERFPEDIRTSLQDTISHLQKTDKAIYAELQRLSQLWKETHPPLL